MKYILFFILRCLQSLLSVIGNVFGAIIAACSRQAGFTAEFGSTRSIASRFNHGFFISKNRKLSRRASFSNLLLVGVTGSGKSTKIILKCLFTLRNCSILISDPSKELFTLSSGILSKHFNIRTLNFSDSSISSGFNLLSRIKKLNDINRFVHVLVASSLEKGGSSSDPFWNLQAKTCLSIIIQLIMYQPEEYRNMANVLHLLNMFSAYPDKIDMLIANTKDEKLILTYKSFISTPEKTQLLIIASAKSALQAFEDPEIAKTSSFDSIDFDDLRKTPTIIFLHNSVSDQKYVSTLNSLFFEAFYNHVLQCLPHKHELDLFCILEEASSLYIPLLPLAAANCRKHRLGNLISVQSKNQLKTFYKEEAESIASNCVHKLYLAGLTALDELREIEALSGKCTYKDDKEVERVKPLVTTDEIRLLPENRSLIISGNKPIIKGWVSPYWRNLIFRQYAKIPPIPLRGDIPDTPIQLIKI